MSGGSPTTATPDGKIEIDTAPEWSYQNGGISGVNEVEKKLEAETFSGYPAQTMIPHGRKAKRKDDGPLEIFCGWIVEHQIGKYSCPQNYEQ
jgi:acyl-CoA-dependent ceramide synthase